MNRILKRAELAQMTRQLKMNLGKVPNPKVTVESKSKETRKKRANVGVDRDIEEAIKKVSPKKNRVETGDAKENGKENNNNPHESPIKTYRRPRTPPPAPPVSSSSSMRSDQRAGSRGEIPTPPKSHNVHNIPAVSISTTGGEDSDRPHERSHTDHASRQVLTTPKRGYNRTPATSENEVGADLLMYLAASPYTSSSSLRGSRQAYEMSRLPTTPMAYHNEHPANDDDDAIRFSHMKPSMASPQSTFKVPMQVAHGNLPSSAPHSELLMDSPSLYMASSMSPHKRGTNDHPPHTTSSTLQPHIPSTPSRELRVSSSHLLKTPNFNMGDYVHNLFSPSPRVGPPSTATAASQQNHTSLHQQDLRNSN